VVALIPLVLADSLRARVVFDARHPGAVLWAFPVLFFGCTLWVAFIASAIRYFHRRDTPQNTADSSRRALGIFGYIPPQVFPIVGIVVAAFVYFQLRAPYVPSRQHCAREHTRS
jgi:hypothetical protein